MEKAELLRRLGELELEAQRLKDAIGEESEPKRFARVRGIGAFANRNWVLLSFLSAIAVAAYVQVEFDIDYFENYRQVVARRKASALHQKTSELHQKLGDRFMGDQRWKAAKAAYTDALDVDPYNLSAVHGQMMAMVWDPLEGEELCPPEIVRLRLEYLEKLMEEPQGEVASDSARAQLEFLKAMECFNRGDYLNAITLCEKARGLDPEFHGSHLLLGYIYMGSYDMFQETDIFDIEKSVTVLELALGLDADDPEGRSNLDWAAPDVLSNLGYNYLLLGRDEEAIEFIKRSYMFSPRPVTMLSLADAYRAAGKFQAAHFYDSRALSQLEKVSDENAWSSRDTWKFSRLPLEGEETDVAKKHVELFDLDTKRSFAGYMVSVDLAARNLQEEAGEAFARASGLDPTGYLREIVTNRYQRASQHDEINIEAKW